jgi:hypothetical protein
MIYMCICPDREQEVMSYSALTSVVYDESQLFSAVFEADDCTIIAITDDFINRKLKPQTLIQTIHEFRRIKRMLSIVLIGKGIIYEGQDAHLLERDWNIAGDTIKAIEQAVQHPPTQVKTRNTLLDDLKLNIQSPDLFLHYAINNLDQLLPFLSGLVAENIGVNNEILGLRAAVDTLSLENMALGAELYRTKERLSRQHENYAGALNAYNSLHDKITRQYDIRVSREGEAGFDIAVNRYQAIMYVKELTRVHYVDSLVYYAQAILNTLYATPTRLFVIEKPYSYSSAKMYPNLAVHSQLTYSDLKTRDIVSVGYQKDILNSVLQNQAQSNYLIILDRSGSDFLAVRGDRVKAMYTLSDYADNAHFNVPDDTLISYTEGTHVIPHIPDFGEMSVSEKIKAYSSLPITKSFINALEGTA